MASDDDTGESFMESGHGNLPNVDGVLSADLKGITGMFSGKAIDHASLCTATEDQACQIVRHLSVLNEVLSQAELELMPDPTTPSRMTIASVDSPYVRDHSLEMLHKAVTLLCQFVKTHHCVTYIDVSLTRLHLYGHTLCDALRDHEFIETLKLRDLSELHHDTHESFCVIVPMLRKLRHFECTFRVNCGKCWPSFMQAITSLLLTTRSLTSLRIPNIFMNRWEAEEFLTAVMMCSSLKELSLNLKMLSFARKECCAGFSDYLKSRTTLTKLSLEGYNSIYSVGMQLILRGVSENKTITTLCVRTAWPREQCCQALCDVLRNNTTLHNVHVVPTLCYLSTNSATWDNWLRAVVEHQTLEELTLPLNISTTQQWARFFDELSKKRKLVKVRLVGDIGNADTLQQFCEALRASGAEEKVVFTPCIDASCHAYAFHFVKYKCFRDVVAFQADSASDAAPLRKLLHELCSLNHVTSLTVDINPRSCRENLSPALSHYIATTTTLERLQLTSVSIEYGENEIDIAWTPIVKSLAINNSLTNLSIRAFCMARDDSENLADVIKYSNNIRRFSMSVQKEWNEALFVNRLSLGIRGNYCVVKIELPVYMDEDMFAVWDTARRNLSLVTSASQFFEGARCDKHIAASLERVYRHRALLEELAEVQCVSVVEVAAALREQVRAFEDVHEFMRLAGVVKERVACHPRLDGRVQLDDLNEYCWIAIRRYLMLADVVDECAD